MHWTTCTRNVTCTDWSPRHRGRPGRAGMREQRHPRLKYYTNTLLLLCMIYADDMNTLLPLILTWTRC